MDKPAIKGIQYLRGLAALMVVSHHAQTVYFFHIWTDWGARGVDIFFVISGLVMALSTQTFDPASGRGRQAMAFVVNRFIRVVPMYWLSLLWAYKHPQEPLSSYLMDFAFLPRWNESAKMIAPAFVPGWTINYEIFFYLIFAVAMFTGSARYFWMTLVLVTLVLLGYTHPASVTGQFLTNTHLLEFLFGVGLHHVLRMRATPAPPRWTLWAVLIACFGLLAFEMPAPFGVFYGLIAAAIVWTGVVLLQDVRLVGLKAIGDASYSIYLFHIATFRQVGLLCHRLGLDGRDPVTIVLVVCIHVLIATLAGWVIHRLIERPLLKFMRSWSKRERGPVPQGA